MSILQVFRSQFSSSEFTVSSHLTLLCINGGKLRYTFPKLIKEKRTLNSYQVFNSVQKIIKCDEWTLCFYMSVSVNNNKNTVQNHMKYT